MPRLHHVALTLAAVLAAPLAPAAEFIVTRTDDPVAGACAPGDCSLREAVLAANASAGADTVRLPAGTLTVADTELPVDDDLTIAGAGVDTSTVFNTLETLIHLDGARLSLLDLTIDGPPPVDDVLTAVLGENGVEVDALRVRIPVAGGLLTLRNGAVTLDVDDSSIDWTGVSQAEGSVQFRDSTLAVVGVSDGPVTLRLEHVRVDGDTDPPLGGGVALTSAGEATIVDSEFANALFGITLQGANAGNLRVERTDWHDSGPLWALTPTAVTIVDSVFHDNTNIQERPGAIHLGNGAHATVQGSSFIHNTGDSDTGGAIRMDISTELGVFNSTFSNNTFTAAAAESADGARGAAIGIVGNTAHPPVLTLNHVTIVAPTFAPVGVEGSAIGVRNGAADSQTIVINSILRGTCRFGAVLGGSFGVAYGNIESPGHGCGLDDATNLDDVSSADLALGSLDLHGGATPNYLPDADSAVVGAGESTYCLASDQRHWQRPIADGCDVGAIEVDGFDRIFADGYD